MPQIEKDMRLRLVKFLPKAFETALASYRIFTAHPPIGFSKEKGKSVVGTNNFKTHHDACKVALAHIQLLLKLAEMVSVSDPEEENEEHFLAMQRAMKSAFEEIKEVGENP